VTAPLWWDDPPALSHARHESVPLGPAATHGLRDIPARADVVIVGAGYTGLWTAYYLLKADPSLDVVVLEAEHVGFGASGRNGG
jgi:NADPH-dependent 2,4-dienoyl-CoA reductase/sulfur reductase-like enzyme